MQNAKDPPYKGRQLSQWLEELAPSYGSETRLEAESAVRAIGTNAIPLLLSYLSERENFPLQAVRRRVEVWLRVSPREEPIFLHIKAIAGFRALGTEGRPATAALARLMSRGELAYDSARALGALGDPALLQNFRELLLSQDPRLRSAGAAGLGEEASAARPFVSSLARLAIADTEEQVRASAVEALARIGPASRVVPIIVNRLQNDTSPTVQCCAASGLGFFPESSNLFQGALEEACRNHSPKVRAGAAFALRRLQQASAQ